MAKINVRNKGAAGEREIAEILQRVVNEVYTICGQKAPKLRRNVEQSQVGGEDLVGLPWYSFEVKRVERVDLDRWWAQTCVQAARKAPAASTAEAQRLGGWKALQQAGVGVGSQGVTGGGSGCLGGGKSARGASVEAGPGAPEGLGLYLAAQSGWECGQAAPIGGPVGSMPLPVWAGLGGSVALGGGLGRSVDRSPVVGVPTAIVIGGGSGDEVYNGDSSPVEGRTVPCGHSDMSEGPNGFKAPPVTREAVLLWRQNKQPWRVRFIGTLVSINGLRLASVIDASLETWLEVFRNDLEHRLRG